MLRFKISPNPQRPSNVAVLQIEGWECEVASERLFYHSGSDEVSQCSGLFF